MGGATLQGPWLYRVLVALGLALALVGVVWLRSAVAVARSQAAHPVTAAVLVPRATLVAGSVLVPAEFALRRLPVADAPAQSVSAPGQVAGAVARQTLFAGEPVVAGMLYPNLAAAQMDEQLPGGMRAFDLPVGSASGVGGLLAAGDRVDVVVVVNAGGTPQATTILSDVPVLGLVGGNAGATNVAGVSSAGSYTSVVLELTPVQAAAAALAQSEGTVTLTMRNPHDTGTARPTVTLSGLKGGVG